MSNDFDKVRASIEVGKWINGTISDTARIPAPKPHQTWFDWRKSAKASSTWNDDEGNSQQHNHHRGIRQTDITQMSPPVPNDEMNANLCELRRQIGYLPLLSQYKSQTDIVNVFMGEPYRMPDRLIERLIRIANMASILSTMYDCTRAFILVTSKWQKMLLYCVWCQCCIRRLLFG